MEVILTASTGTLGLITAVTLLVLWLSLQRANTKRGCRHRRYMWTALTWYVQAETLFQGSHGCGAPHLLP